MQRKRLPYVLTEAKFDKPDVDALLQMVLVTVAIFLLFKPFPNAKEGELEPEQPTGGLDRRSNGMCIGTQAHHVPSAEKLAPLSRLACSPRLLFIVSARLRQVFLRRQSEREREKEEKCDNSTAVTFVTYSLMRMILYR